VILEIDIWRVAFPMMECYGDKADIESAIRAEELAEAGDWTGEAIWRRIVDAITQLIPLHMCSEPLYHSVGSLSPYRWWLTLIHVGDAEIRSRDNDAYAPRG
jgi:hypothetical protein